MTDQLPTPRRRVRTGCLTCRGRRRKCDETRPVCQSCRSRNLKCRYGLNIVFVPAKEARIPQAVSSIDSSISTDDTSTSGAISRTAARQIHPVTSLNSSQSPLSRSTTDDTDPFPLDKVQSSHHVAEVDLVQSARWDVISYESNVRAHTSTTVESTRAASNEVTCQSMSQHGEPGEEQDLRLESEIDAMDEADELELLQHYLYRLAVILDLGMGDLHYGIQMMLDARQSPHVHRAILVVSSYHRAATELTPIEADRVMSQRCVKEAYQVDHARSQSEHWNGLAMNALTIILTKPPELWLDTLHTILSRSATRVPPACHRSLLARIILGAIVISTSQDNTNLVDCILDDFSTGLNAIDTDHVQQELQISLSLLAESIRIGRAAALDGKQFFQVWRTCWDRIGVWYSGRAVEMQEILRLSEMDGVLSDNTRVFPFILFSNACAAVANVVYHLAAIILLQSKPRLIEPSRRHCLSVSSTLHALHLIGIADTATENEFWDPIVAVAVVHAAKKLSHRKQRSAAAHVLTKIVKVSGMQFGPYIDELLSVTGT